MARMLSKNILLLAFLYFIQGLPYGFQTSFLPIILRKHGISLTKLGLFRLLFLPWLCRALWAPLVDLYGTKHRWLLASVLALMLTCLLGSVGSPDHLAFLCVVLLLLNTFAATQDIVVDGVAITILAADELGAGNTAQVVGYKLGAIFGGGLLVWLMGIVGWTGMFLGLAVLYLEALLFVYLSPDLRRLQQYDIVASRDVNDMNLQEQQEPDEVLHDVNRQLSAPPRGARNRLRQMSRTAYTELEERDTERDTTSKTCKSVLCRIVAVPGTRWMLAYVLIYKLGEIGAQNMLPLFLVDNDISADTVVFWTGFIGQILSIAGSLLGGWALSYHRLPVYFMLRQSLLLRLFPVGLLTACVAFGTPDRLASSLPYYAAVVSICLLQLIGGIITTATFTFMMRCSQMAPFDIQSTHYTVLSTFEVLGKLIFSSVIGLVTDWTGYPFAFVIFIILSVAVVPWYRKCPSVLYEEESATEAT